MSFEDPSIVSMTPPQPTNEHGSTNDGGNAILNLLKQGERNKEQEEKESMNIEKNTSAQNQPQTVTATSAAEPQKEDEEERDPDLLPTGGSKHTATKKIVIEDWPFTIRDYTDGSITRYIPSELLRLRESPLVAPPEGLPPRDYYRPDAKVPQTQARRGGYGYQNARNYENTGAMGNFNLGRNGGRQQRNGNSRRNQRGRRDEDMIPGLDRNAPAIGNADDFEKWKAQMSSGIRGSKKEEEGHGVVHEEPKNAVDSFFGMAARSTASQLDRNDTAEGAKNSRFFSMFAAPEASAQQTPPSQDVKSDEAKGDVSKLLSFLDRGEKASEKEAANGPPGITTQGQSQPQRSQFFAQPSSPAPPQQKPQFPPGLGPQNKQKQPHGDSFLQSLMKDPSAHQSGAHSNSQAMEPSNDKSGAPPQGSPSQDPQGQNPQNAPKSGQQFQQPPPGLQGLPQGMPPWMNPNLPPNMRQQFPPHGRFMPMQGMPPQGMPQGMPPGIPYQGQFPPPHMMYPPQMNDRGMPAFAPQGQHQQGQQPQGQNPQGQDDLRFPPGFFQGPPPGFMPVKR